MRVHRERADRAGHAGRPCRQGRRPPRWRRHPEGDPDRIPGAPEAGPRRGGSIDATANNVDYNLQTETVVFTGNVEINQPGRGTMGGGRIVYNMATGRVQGGGEEGGQVRTRILPRGARADQDGN